MAHLIFLARRLCVGSVLCTTANMPGREDCVSALCSAQPPTCQGAKMRKG